MDAPRNGPESSKGQPRGPLDWRVLHLWQIQPLRDAAIIVAIVGLVYVGQLLSIVTVPMLLALALAYLFEPLAGAVTRRTRVGRPAFAVGLIVGAFLVVVVPVSIGAVLGVAQGARFVQGVAVNVEKLVRSVDNPDDPSLREALPVGWRRAHDYLVEQERANRLRGTFKDAAQGAKDAVRPPVAGEAPIGAGAEEVSPTLAYQIVRWAVVKLRENSEAISKQALQSGADAIGAAFRTLGTLGVLGFQAFLTAFFFFFFCTGFGRVLEFTRDLVPRASQTRTFALIRKMDRAIASFIRGRLTICAILVGYYTLLYWIIGVPAPLVLGPLVGIVSLLPYISSLSVPVCILLLWLEPHTGFRAEWWWIVFAPAAVFFGAQALDDYILTPSIQGKQTDMNTPAILFASIAGGVLGGFYGLLLAIPVAACLKILLTDVFWPRFRAWSEGKARDLLPIENT